MIKKTIFVLTGLTMLVILFACGNIKSVCKFPDSPNVVAPAWVCGEPVKGIKLSAVGYSQKSAAGRGFMKQIAFTHARVQISQRKTAEVTGMVKGYTEVTGETETVDTTKTPASKQITNETLTHLKVIKSTNSPTGGLYVLIGLAQDSK